MGWYNASWDYRVKITIAFGEVDGAVSDFPVYVDLSDLDSDFFTNVKSGGEDIRVTQANGTTEQAREIVVINTGASTGEMHFKASSLSPSGDTDFYIYYGNSGASEPAPDSTYGSEEAWDEYYTMVLHLQGSGTEVVDSTGNGNDSSSTSSSGSQTDGHITKGRFFDGSNEHQNFPDVTTILDASTATISLWAKWASISNDTLPSLFGSRDAWPTGDIVEQWESVGNMYFRYGDGATEINFAYTPPFDAFENWAFTYDNAAGAEVWIDAVSKASVSTTWPAASLSGTFKIAQFSNYTLSNYAGVLDEFRVSNIVRADEWISTEYNNQSNTATFYTLDTQEERPEAVIQTIINIT